jgi:hypothetical protein
MKSNLEIHAEICDGIKKLYADKNADYKDSFKLVRDKFPNSILIRLNDKLCRLEQFYLLGEDGMKVKDESIEDTLRDLANYCLLELVERELDKQRAEESAIASLQTSDPSETVSIKLKFTCPVCGGNIPKAGRKVVESFEEALSKEGNFSRSI